MAPIVKPVHKQTAKAAKAAVAWEHAQRRWVVPAAAIAGILPLAAGIAVNAGLRHLPQSRIGALLYFNAHVGALWLGSVMLAIGAVCVGATLLFMARAVAARDPTRMPKAMPWVIGVGAALYALTGTLLSGTAPPFGLVAQALTSRSVGQFASTGSQTWQQADSAFKSAGLTFASVAEIACSLLLLAAIVLVSLNAIKVGLMTRFMGYVGVFVGALTVLPVLSTLPVVQAFWFVALAALIAGRWPGTMPEAWSSGKAEPWPTMAEQRERAGGASRPGRMPAPAPAPPPRPARPVQESANPGAARRKRKRKH